MAFTETWLLAGDTDGAVISDVTPTGYVFRHVSRERRGGGVAVLCKKSLNVKINSMNRYKSFEYIDTMLHSNSKTLRLVVVYRPPPSRTNGLTNELFFEEFENFLEHLAAHKDQIMVVGDFNFHVDDQNNISAGKLLQLLQTFDYVQQVKEATHKDNHILDLIISRSDDHIVCRPSVQDPALSDHYTVRCKFLLAKPSFKRKEIAYRNLKRINFDRFREDIINSALMESINQSILI